MTFKMMNISINKCDSSFRSFLLKTLKKAKEKKKYSNKKKRASMRTFEVKRTITIWGAIEKMYNMIMNQKLFCIFGGTNNIFVSCISLE